MIRVGFIGFWGEWHGGQNYLRNLLYAISQLKDRGIEPVVFLGQTTPQETVDLYAAQALVVKTSFLDKYHWAWCLSKATSFFGRGQWVFESFLLKHKIQVLFCTPGLAGFDRVKVLNWIPDFQHLHLGDLSNPLEIILRNKSFRVAILKSSRIILSSQDALKDLASFAPQAVSKARVLHFVGQVDRNAFEVRKDDSQGLKHKYHLPAKFFYMPNQWWKHKNHIVIFKALDQLKKEGEKVTVVCSGGMDDYRHKEHAADLKKFIADHRLDGNIILLGKIPLGEVYLLYAACFAVINPSLFEGWSTTVEESKTLGKKILLSDIPVHREQAPEDGVYFDPLDVRDAAGKLKQVWAEWSPMAAPEKTIDLQNCLRERTLEFAGAFQGIVEEALKG